MKNQDTYSRIMEALRRNAPVLADKEKLEEQIMSRIRESGEQSALQERVSRYLFGWTDHGWIRRSMAAAATLIIGIFIIQQISVTRRINDLEERLITTVNGINQSEPGMGIMQKAFLNRVIRDRAAGDSITVSRADMEELLDSYLELRENYNLLKQYMGPGPFPDDVTAPDTGDAERKDPSNLNL